MHRRQGLDHARRRVADRQRRRATTASATHFTVNIIPHTAAATTLGDLAAGRQLNVEIDVLARYLERMMAAPITLQHEQLPLAHHIVM